MFDAVENFQTRCNDKPRYLMGVGTPSDILGAVNGELTCSIVLCQQDLEELDLLLWEEK